MQTREGAEMVYCAQAVIDIQGHYFLSAWLTRGAVSLRWA